MRGGAQRRGAADGDGAVGGAAVGGAGPGGAASADSASAGSGAADSSPRDLVIVGAGGFAREAAQAVRALAGADLAAGRPPRLRLLGHLDDDPALHGLRVDGVPVLGGCDLVRELPAALVVVCAGSPRDHAVRARLVRRLALPASRHATVVHPTASVADSCVLGPGTVVLAHCALTAAVRVGAHAALMPHAVLTHDDVVEDFATLASGVRLGGGVRVARGAYVGAGALVREYAVVGAWSLVGMGSLVLGDVPPGEVWAGAPARRMRAAGAAELAELTASAAPAASPGSAAPGADGADARPPRAAAAGTARGKGTGMGTGTDTRMGSPAT